MLRQFRLEVLRYKCISCGYCRSIAPDLIDFSRHDGLVTSIFTPNFDSDIQTINDFLADTSTVEQIVRICPTKAMSFLLFQSKTQVADLRQPGGPRLAGRSLLSIGYCCLFKV